LVRLDSFVPVAGRHLLVTCFCVGSNRLAHIDDVFWMFSVHPSHTYRADVSHSAHNKYDNMPFHCGGRVRMQGSLCGMFNGRAALKRVCLLRVYCHSNLYHRRSLARALAALLNEV
jgi:hypothetical protein